ncbi:Fpg/Nei family DNA glycosylase [Paenibacillus ferrarius]|uniref:Fpg/Nei family DNA glycosylase n=1 Tax=Paenibacillus ferrarius TaxID=1469647 RepID=UPI003D2B6D8F
MPELPEMETYRQQLSRCIQGKTITGAEVTRPKSLNVEPEAFIRAVTGTRVLRLERRAKHLLFHLSSERVLVLHLMLGGWLFYGTDAEKPDRTFQITLDFQGEHLYFIGLRLGYLHLHAQAEVEDDLQKLGPEPFTLGFAEFQKVLASKRANLKVALTDQSFLSGIGNCYSDEICFIAGLLPSRTLPSLSDEEQLRLFEAMGSVLREAIQYGGYMANPLFVGDSLTGGFDAKCRVYDREGEPCVRCGQPIVFTELSSRKCFYCASCQS